MPDLSKSLPDSREAIGALGFCHLERFRRRLISRAPASVRGGGALEWHYDKLLLDSLGLGLEQTLAFIAGNIPSLEEFETWIEATAGRPDVETAARFNAVVRGEAYSGATMRRLASVDAADDVFSPADLEFWRINRYVVLANAVDPENLRRTVEMIWRAVDGDPEDPETWYRGKTTRTMLQVFQHPALTSNRLSPRIHKAFAQLWGTSDLQVTTDRCGFSAPLRPDETTQAPPMHWDIDFRFPGYLGTQGILYLTDTRATQGAFSVVPGFHLRLKDWLATLPPGTDPNTLDLEALNPHPIAGSAGDLIIWHSSLPHGSRPNHHARPRIVHYINMYPARFGVDAGNDTGSVAPADN